MLIRFISVYFVTLIERQNIPGSIINLRRLDTHTLVFSKGTHYLIISRIFGLVETNLNVYKL